MSFTKKSEKFIKGFVKEFENYCVKKSQATQTRTENILKIVFNDIKRAEHFVKLAEKKKKIHINVKELNSLRELPKTELMDSNFIPGSIKDYILYNILGYMKASININGIDINIYYAFFKKSDFNQLKKIKKEIYEAIKIIKVCSLYSKLKSIKSLNIYLYLTDNEKKIPTNPVLVLGPNNCNSAVTYACAKNGRLMIYRREEWKKVLIHELFHSLYLDFSGISYNNLKNNIKKIFDVQSDFEISESYSEFWATILNSCFVSYNLLDGVGDIDTFLLFTDFCIQLERIFSLFQMVKLLHFMGLRYTNLYKQDKLSSGFRKILYKEDTNVLCYYVIKTLLLFYNDDFLKWCTMNNNNIIRFDKTDQNLDNLYKFIQQKHNSVLFNSYVNKMELFFKKMRGPLIKNNELVNTSRMSICEN